MRNTTKHPTPTLHMIKLCVGCDTPDQLRAWGRQNRHGDGTWVGTRMMPKQAEALVGGSLYRVMGGFITCRQPITGFRTVTRDDGTKGTLILVTDEVIEVEATLRRPFQGWRYLKPEDAPPDLDPLLAKAMANQNAMPPSIRKRLAELGIV
ncbi:DUF1489 family protein [Formicincola oecophyllae]|uniref:DUF1489 family protein n=1 Tax=Formicincola oecophyllae TaxID=2558361 RepID=A0A4Y6U955_9PROT|nr:DUF1489 domain-containing protein [Formicincola oecophyllae]QDH13734.1 DUF1489 family protein [Formicincola oecophyllae]